jgi:hypothetical protein
MQVEEQNQPVTMSEMSEIVPHADSDESKPKRGGKRRGAGRKPNLAKALLKGVSRSTILAAVEMLTWARSSLACCIASVSKPA